MSATTKLNWSLDHGKILICHKVAFFKCSRGSIINREQALGVWKRNVSSKKEGAMEGEW